ncbi:MAG: transcriptional activator NhaR [Myxococcales bacterium]|nr:transcriptional activator NhaR [Myxococcales bacterium]MCB9524687.1 transcriptional activator NhaR [Myxococcales bacterium]
MEWLNYHHLFYFWMVAREGSVAQASRELNLTPQTISAQIRTLESYLDEQLFERRGRRLHLTGVGQFVFEYAETIFATGREMLDALRKRPSGAPMKLVVGVTDAMPKLVVHRLLQPALELDPPVRLAVTEAPADELLADLAVHRVDLVLTDAPVTPRVKVRAYNHQLGECGVTFMAAPKLAATLRKDFPRSLDGAPVLLPTSDTMLRRSLDSYFERHRVRPNIVGEFADSALMKVFGQHGNGVFAIPDWVTAAVQEQYHVEPVGPAEGVVERFYAISVERRLKHPAVVAISEAARNDLGHSEPAR